MKKFLNISHIKYNLLFIFLFLNNANINSQTLLSDPITGASITPSRTTYFLSSSGTTIHPNITADGIRIGTGVTALTGNNTYPAYGWTTNNFDSNDYFEISLTPNSCSVINFNQLVIDFTFFDQNKNFYGPLNFAVRSSLDSYTSDIATWSRPEPSGGNTVNASQTITLPPTFDAVTSNIKFRIYGWNSTDGSSAAYFSINDYSLTGTVTTPVATPIVGTIVHPSCPTPTGSVTLSNLPSTGTYTINQFGTVTNTLTGLSGTSRTISGLVEGTYTFSVTNSLGCTSLTTSNVIINSNSTTWNGSSWSNLAPDLTKTVIISGNYDMVANASLPNIKACRITVTNNASVVVKPGAEIVIQNNLVVNTGSSFIIQNSGNLVQLNNTPSPANSINGTFSMRRTANNLKQFDYVYWSSPVMNFPVTNVSPSTPIGRIYNWVPDYNNGTGTPPTYGYGNWFNVNENMIGGKGYIIRVADSNTSFSTTFTGAPNNGIINRTIVRGPYQGSNYIGATGKTITNKDDNWNLVGNPYPSSIDADKFLIANNGVILGQVNLWTHSTAIGTSNPNQYYQSFTYNYNSADYIIYNLSGPSTGPATFNGKIASGQGFMVNMIDGPATSGTLTFNNSMRADASSNAYNNTNFFRTSETTSSIEKSRIWLDLIDDKLNTKRFMVGYIEGATNQTDHLYDATSEYSTSLMAFSIIENDEQPFVIQGKQTPFDINDNIKIGYQVTTSGNYKFAISEVDGLFKDINQKIYIEDLLTGITHDLTVSPYSFDSDKGVFKNRFILKYNQELLSNDDNYFGNSVIIHGENQLITKSELHSIKNITVYDLLGKTITIVDDISSKEIEINLNKTNSVLLVKVTLENGAIVTKKVIY